jgi:glycosyltransferase involved in cell wall biosynthesis
MSQPRPRDTVRILIASNSHPALTKGGAEIAAYELFRGLSATAGFDPYFLACAREPNLDRFGPAITQPFGAREFIYTPTDFDWFRFANRDRRFPAEFRDLLATLKPDIVHFQHYASFGVEAFQFVRETLPNAAILATLHEYLLICNHFGQMITRPARNLCYEASPLACARCFPERTAADFFLRHLYTAEFLRHVDQFLAPSRFLARRYIDWGIPADRMVVIENVIAAATPPEAAPVRHVTPAPKPAPEKPAALTATLSAALSSAVPERTSWLRRLALADSAPANAVPPETLPAPPAASIAPPARGADRKIRLAFFGQISALKGIRVFLDAARILEDEANHDIIFEIFGDHRNQPPEFQTEFLEALAQAGRNTHFHGPYEQPQVDALMQSVDLVCVPSIWWENSPVVIQEALRNRRPVICSNIGGMAEKVRNGLDGVHFVAGSAHALAQTVAHLAADPARIAALQATIRSLPAPAETIDRHVRLYLTALATVPAVA